MAAFATAFVALTASVQPLPSIPLHRRAAGIAALYLVLLLQSLPSTSLTPPRQWQRGRHKGWTVTPSPPQPRRSTALHTRPASPDCRPTGFAGKHPGHILTRTTAPLLASYSPGKRSAMRHATASGTRGRSTVFAAAARANRSWAMGDDRRAWYLVERSCDFS